MPEADALTPDVVLHSAHAYRGKLISVRVDTVRLPNGNERPREVVEHPGAIALVPVLPDGRVVLVRQWRRAAGEVLLEVPAGTREPGEAPAATAARELREETGYMARDLILLGAFFSAPGFCTEKLECYLAVGLTAGAATPEEDEGITLVSMPLADVPAAVARGEIHDAKSVAAVAMAQHYLATHPELAP